VQRPAHAPADGGCVLGIAPSRERELVCECGVKLHAGSFAPGVAIAERFRVS
jgi:hypothetical protein